MVGDGRSVDRIGESPKENGKKWLRESAER